MNNGWITCFLGEICDITAGKRPDVKANSPSSEMNIPVYGGNGIAWYTNKFLLDIDSPVILTGRVGTLGTYFHVVGKCWVSDNALIITPKTVDPNFLYYYMKMLPIESLNRGSTQPLLTQSDLKQIRLFIPKDIKEQKKISNILKILDDKIELNNKINKNLEEQAQTLFRSWFINFEPFGGTMPAKREKIRLEELCSLVSRGYNTKYVPTSNLINLNQKANRGTYIEKKYYKYLDESIPVPQEKFACKGDILINSMGVGTVGRIHLWNNELANVVVDQCITIVRAKSNIISPEYLYLTLTSPEYTHYLDKNTTGSTGMVSLNIKAVRDCKIFVPDKSVLFGFNNIVKPIYNVIASNLRENNHLDTIRDTLLPMLMSGEIDVSKVDISDLGCVDKLSVSEGME